MNETKAMIAFKNNRIKEVKRALIHSLMFAAMFAAVPMLMAACGEAERCSYDDKPAADLSGYSSMAPYYEEGSEPESETEQHHKGNDTGSNSNDIKLVDTNVKEIEKMMKDSETFAFIASFADCPYCDQLMPYINEASKRADRKVGHLDTRKDPDWENNMDMDDYDTFAELFGKYLDKENDGKAHLYTPMVFFIKNGEIVAYHKNVIEGADDPKVPLAKTLENKLNRMLDEKFEQMI